MRKSPGFTLLEIVLAVFIALLLLTLAVPSIGGLLAEQQIKQSFDRFDAMAHDAQARSIAERRAFVIAWDDKGLALRPQVAVTKEEAAGVARIELAKEETFEIELPAALVRKPAKQWFFWPTGTCEPAVIRYHGSKGAWTGTYDPLTVRADFSTP